jgi:hypothetical protein
MRAYIDADVLIWHLRGKEQARDFLIRLRDNGAYELWTGALQRAEIIFFMRPDEHEATEVFLSQFKTEPVDQKLVDAAGVLYRRWQPSHGIDVNDAMLAAAAIQNGGRIFTLNIKYYPMPEVNVQKAWE